MFDLPSAGSKQSEVLLACTLLVTHKASVQGGERYKLHLFVKFEYGLFPLTILILSRIISET